jgi:hypothetical protein
MSQSYSWQSFLMIFSNFVKLFKTDVHDIEVSKMLFLRGKRKLTVNVSKLKTENRKSLLCFLTSKLDLDVKIRGNKILIYDDFLSTKELKHLVKNFVYHQYLNHNFWVKMKDDAIKLRNLKHAENEKEHVGATASTIKHGW